ncbi:NaeI very short patch repair endonuclease [uncultured Mycobacterium sp.]|uniref:NaeI very short patch repair endonuclease n=1 Tax=uncultured Mycobacterium sp. TaxID=171292 RepID=A0A1Y5PJ41_9MYCO|nr:NaeI very short patch repair endonuclease [uncultured Mycobacterium sp.]
MTNSNRSTTPVGHEAETYVTTPGRSRNMAAIRRTNTKPEVALRSALHRAGYRFRKDFAIRVDRKLMRPDIAFTKRRVAVFVDGCFWHSCPEHGRKPTVNGEYWSPKLVGNAERDKAQTAALQSEGWTVLRFWEHEHEAAILAAIQRALQGD